MECVLWYCSKCGDDIQNKGNYSNLIHDHHFTNIEDLKRIVDSNYLTVINYNPNCECTNTIMSFKSGSYLKEIYNEKYIMEYGQFNIRLYPNIIEITIPSVNSQINVNQLLKVIKPGTIINIFFCPEGKEFIHLKNKILLEKSFELQKLTKWFGPFAYEIYIVKSPSRTKRALQ